MVENRVSARGRGLGLLAIMGLLGALLVPLAVIPAATASPSQGCGVTQAPCTCGGGGGTAQGGDDCQPEPCFDQAQGTFDECRDDPCSTERNGDSKSSESQGNGQSPDAKCCPDGSLGHWEWGGYGGQNLYWCDAPPDTPPATAPPTSAPTTTDPPAVSPTAEAAKKATPAAAKPVFTG